MRDFLHRRSSLLIDEARRLAAEGADRQACSRVLATCNFLEESFGWTHRELPALYQLLSDLISEFGESEEAGRFLHKAWELRRAQSRRVARLLAISRLEACYAPTIDPGRWPLATDVLWTRLREDSLLDPPPEVLVFGPFHSGKTHFLQAFGHEAIDRLWPTRFFLAYELIEHLLRARRDLGLHRALQRLDRFSLLLIDELDPWSLKEEESECLHTTLVHRRRRQCTMIAVATEGNVAESQFLSAARGTRGLRSIGPDVVLLGFCGVP